MKIDFDIRTNAGGRFVNLSLIRWVGGGTVFDPIEDPTLASWAPSSQPREPQRVTPVEAGLILQTIYWTNNDDVGCFDIYDACESECCDNCAIRRNGDCTRNLRTCGPIDCDWIQEWVCDLLYNPEV